MVKGVMVERPDILEEPRSERCKARYQLKVSSQHQGNDSLSSQGSQQALSVTVLLAGNEQRMKSMHLAGLALGAAVELLILAESKFLHHPLVPRGRGHN